MAVLTNCSINFIDTLNMLCQLFYHSLFVAMELLIKQVIGLQVETAGDSRGVDHGTFLSVMRLASGSVVLVFVLDVTRSRLPESVYLCGGEYGWGLFG